MRKLILLNVFILSGMLINSGAMACDSFEDCLNYDKTHDTATYDIRADFYLKAIAYKLDEISKKLDKLAKQR